MKIRTDFVTNSSSSSFIFGEPGKRTIDIPDVVNIIRDAANKIMEMFNTLDSMLLSDEHVAEDIQAIREGYADWEIEENVKIYIDNNKGIISAIEVWIKDNKLDIEVDDILSAYTSNSDYTNIKAIAESTDKWSLPISSKFINIRKASSEDKDDIVESICWFIDDYSVSYRDDLEKIIAEAHSKLGEVLVSGECGYIPHIITLLLYDKATHACDHMG